MSSFHFFPKYIPADHKSRLVNSVPWNVDQKNEREGSETEGMKGLFFYINILA
jgi:hypothetical protein